MTGQIEDDPEYFALTDAEMMERLGWRIACIGAEGIRLESDDLIVLIEGKNVVTITPKMVKA